MWCMFECVYPKYVYKTEETEYESVIFETYFVWLKRSANDEQDDWECVYIGGQSEFYLVVREL